jgi:hypothetical protein
MKLLGSITLLTFGLATGALAQDAAQGGQKPPAGAQPPVQEQEIKGQAGRDIRVLVLTNVRPDCTSGPLPTVRLVTPANGKITVRRVRLNATNVRQCLALEVPALVAFYRSAPEFEGNDSMTVEIRPAEGAPQLRRITIGVTKAGTARSI